MSGLERYLWFVAPGMSAALLSRPLGNWLDIHHVLAALIVGVVVATIITPIFKRRGGYRIKPPKTPPPGPDRDVLR